LAIQNVQAALRLGTPYAATPPLEDTTRISGEWRPTGWKEPMGWKESMSQVLRGGQKHVRLTYMGWNRTDR
jgi:hypothetical protein